MPEAGLGSSVFASALDVLAAGQLASSVDPKPLIDAYASLSVAVGGYGLSASGIGVSASVSLVELAMKANRLTSAEDFLTHRHEGAYRGQHLRRTPILTWSMTTQRGRSVRMYASCAVP